jgi:putative transposase
VIAQCYVEGVSTRRVDDVAKAMGIQGVSKSQVSRICAELDEVVAAWRNRPLDSSAYPFVWIDALYVKVREAGRICSTAVLVATAVNAEGTVRSSAWTSAPRRTAPPGPRFCAVWSPGVCPV